MTNIDMMITEVLDIHGWVEVKFTRIEEGDIFRMFSPDGVPHRSSITGSNKWRATSKPYPEIIEGGRTVWKIDCEDYEGEE